MSLVSSRRRALVWLAFLMFRLVAVGALLWFGFGAEVEGVLRDPIRDPETTLYVACLILYLLAVLATLPGLLAVSLWDRLHLEIGESGLEGRRLHPYGLFLPPLGFGFSWEELESVHYRETRKRGLREFGRTLFRLRDGRQIVLQDYLLTETCRALVEELEGLAAIQERGIRVEIQRAT